ncbi:MAG: type VI secretion system baseplate subunit TssK [Candidatus Thiodiazotropha sp. (ex Monitilora ramsayi)]|nr:type VI secretion system baseplate subunit TssK [Candidatus Thiodiazotropha sp. (ex Monitilora ramsayi)]
MTLQKVIWAEGIVLGQQHFQAWDTYFEQRQQLLSRAAAPMGWGIIQIDVDVESLKAGVFRLNQCTAVMPCGNLIQYDATTSEPLSCDLTDGDGEDVAIYIGLPVGSSVNGISGYNANGQLCRWEADYQKVPDLYDSSRQREILLARHNLVLIKGSNTNDQFSLLKIADLVNDGTGSYNLSCTFIPAVCRIGASDVLCGNIQRLSELFSVKAKMLRERIRQYGARISDYGPNELSSFLLLQVLNPAAAHLRHFVGNADAHPENLYRSLINIVSVLQCYKADSDPNEITAYEHNDLSQVFIGIDGLLRSLIDAVMPSMTAGMKLNRESELLYSVDSIDILMLEKSSFFLAVNMDNDNISWFQEFPRKVKLGARADIEMIIASAMPGVTLIHTQRPPNRLPIKSGYEYFRLEPKGEFWDRVVENRSMALFLTHEFAKANVELITVEE